MENKIIRMVINKNHPVGKEIEVIYRGKKLFCTQLELLFDWNKKDFVKMEDET